MNSFFNTYVHYRGAITFWLGMLLGQKVAMLLLMKLLFLEAYANMSFLSASSTWIRSMANGLICYAGETSCSCEVIHYSFICRLAYATYMLEQVKKSSGQINHIILYDIACTLHQHLKVLLQTLMAWKLGVSIVNYAYPESWQTRSFARSFTGYSCISCVWPLHKVPGEDNDESHGR